MTGIITNHIKMTEFVDYLVSGLLYWTPNDTVGIQHFSKRNTNVACLSLIEHDH